MATFDHINSRNFIQQIKQMDKADRKRIKASELIDWIVQFEEDATLKSMQNDIATLIANFALLNATATKNQEEIAISKNKNNELQQEVDTLKASAEGGNNDNTLADEIESLKKQLSEIDQYLRINNLEIVGLPEPRHGEGDQEEDETEEELILDALNTLHGLSAPIRPEDIDISHPLNTRRRDGKNVHVVKFISRKKKAEIFTKKKSETNRNYKFRGNNVFINEHLSPKNRSLFATANEKKRTLGFKHLWTRGGTVLMRKTDESPVFTITCEDDFVDVN